MSDDAVNAGAAPQPAGPAHPAFEVTPYRPDGGFSQLGSLLAIGLSLVGGLVLGYAAWFVSQWFFLVLIFPFLIGLALGGLGRLGVRLGKVRSPFMAGLAGFCGGCVAMIAMQYFEYLQFQKDMEKIHPGLRAMAADPNLGKMLMLQPDKEDKNAPDPEKAVAWLQDAVKVNDFLGYIDFSARQGVQLTSTRGGGKDRGINLGYHGSYIYWGIELLIVAGVAFAMTRGAAAEPFCTACNNWKQERPVGTLSHSAAHCSEAVSRGTLTKLIEPPAAGAPIETLTLAAAVCPNCLTNSPVDVKLERLTVSAKGEQQRATLAHVTYPGEALDALDRLFHTSPETPKDLPADESEPPAKP
jgi:hypothetical protein